MVDHSKFRFLRDESMFDAGNKNNVIILLYWLSHSQSEPGRVTERIRRRHWHRDSVKIETALMATKVFVTRDGDISSFEALFVPYFTPACARPASSKN